MKLTSHTTNAFIKHLVACSNDDTYEQLKYWLQEQQLEDDEYNQALDYLCANLRGSLQWVSN